MKYWTINSASPACDQDRDLMVIESGCTRYTKAGDGGSCGHWSSMKVAKKECRSCSVELTQDVKATVMGISLLRTLSLLISNIATLAAKMQMLSADNGNTKKAMRSFEEFVN
jgi:hypothetical protein